MYTDLSISYSNNVSTKKTVNNLNTFFYKTTFGFYNALENRW